MRKKLILLAALFLCMSTASCSEAPANSVPSGSIPSETIPSTNPTAPSTNPTTPSTNPTTPSTNPTTPTESDSIKDKFNCISIASALEKAMEAGNAYTAEEFYIYGKIIKITSPKFGNLVITDGQKEIFYYGTFDENGTKYGDLKDKPVVGDEVVIRSILGTYNGKPQGKNGTIVAFKHAGNEPDIKPTEPITPTEPTKPTTPTETTKPTGPVNPPIDNNLTPEINAYYANAKGTKGELKQSLHDIISVRKVTSYGDLWNTYKKVDLRPDGKIKDIYSNITNFRPGADQAGNYSAEGDKYNREHTIPKSWWGGSTSNQGADPFIVLPSDGFVNGMRSSYSFGEVKSVSKQSKNGYSKLGSSLYGGPSTVFEPADEWKGDMARIYFYATTCYFTDNWRRGDGHYIFTANGNFGLTEYAYKLFLKWHFQDPVSDWEIQRNNGIYQINGNRNPYIDHPEFVEQIWGNVTF